MMILQTLKSVDFKETQKSILDISRTKHYSSSNKKIYE